MLALDPVLFWQDRLIYLAAKHNWEQNDEADHCLTFSGSNLPAVVLRFMRIHHSHLDCVQVERGNKGDCQVPRVVNALKVENVQEKVCLQVRGDSIHEAVEEATKSTSAALTTCTDAIKSINQWGEDHGDTKGKQETFRERATFSSILCNSWGVISLEEGP